MENKMKEIRSRLEKMALAEKDDGGLARELMGVVVKLAGRSGHNAEVIAADLDGKEDVLHELSVRCWKYAREHKKDNGYYMSGETAMQIAAEYFALESVPENAGTVTETEKAPAAPEKKILSLEDLL